MTALVVSSKYDYRDPDYFKNFISEAPDWTTEELATREEMEIEAIKRLEFLTHAGLHTDVLRHFSYRGEDLYYKDYKLYYSAHTRLGGILYWVDQPESTFNHGKQHLRDYINEFEEKFDALVYHAILVHTSDMGDMPFLFYVTKYKNEWEADRRLLTEGRTFIGVIDVYGSWELSTMWYRVLGGGLVMAFEQHIPEHSYPLDHSDCGDDAAPIDLWWKAA